MCYHSVLLKQDTVCGPRTNTMLDLLGDGIQIAVFGMSAVFVLLACLVVALGGMSRLAHALEPATGPAAPGSDDVEVTVAVTAAIHAYRRRRR